MSDFAQLASLVVAQTELSVVQSIRDAEKTTLLHAGGRLGPLGTVLMPRPIPRERLVEPAAIYSPRIIEETIIRRDPAVTIETTNPRPRVEASHAAESVAPRLANEPVPCVEAVAHVDTEAPLGKRLTPLVPPWRLPLPEPSANAIRIVKWEAPQPDVIRKGMLIDLFL